MSRHTHNRNVWNGLWRLYVREADVCPSCFGVTTHLPPRVFEGGMMPDKEQELLSDEEIDAAVMEKVKEKGCIFAYNLGRDEEWEAILEAQVAKHKDIGCEQAWEKCPDCKGHIGKFTGNYHCSNCGKTFRIAEQADFLRHQMGCNDTCPTCKGTGWKRKLVEWNSKKVARTINDHLDKLLGYDYSGIRPDGIIKLADQLYKVLTVE